MWDEEDREPVDGHAKSGCVFIVIVIAFLLIYGALSTQPSRTDVQYSPHVASCYRSFYGTIICP